MEYNDLLDRALDEVPDFTRNETRLTIPDPVVQPDGAFTRLMNLGSIADALSRDAADLHRSIQRDLGTSGQFESDWARYNGTFTVTDFDAAIEEYIEEFVLCSECGLPDTRLSLEDGTQMLRCEACGAFRPVTKRSRSQSHHRRPTLEENNTYRVEITGTGRKGDGIAEKGKYTIFVPGAEEGQVVDIVIESIRGSLAFARLS